MSGCKSGASPYSLGVGRAPLTQMKKKEKKKGKTSTRSKPAKSEANFPDTWRLN